MVHLYKVNLIAIENMGYKLLGIKLVMKFLF